MPDKTTTAPMRKPPSSKALSIWASPERFKLVKRLRTRHKMSFSTIVWSLAEALDAGLIALDAGPRVKTTVPGANASPARRGP